jgi:hypothetical protein
MKTLLLMMTLAVIPSACCDEPIACNLSALTPAERVAHAALTMRLKGAVRKREETATGYAFHLDAHRISEGDLKEWARLESRCCPFFTFDIAAENGLVVTLEGRPGVKQFIAAELALE